MHVGYHVLVIIRVFIFGYGGDLDCEMNDTHL